jgi:Protein of unknown function (DUF3892)
MKKPNAFRGGIVSTSHTVQPARTDIPEDIPVMEFHALGARKPVVNFHKYARVGDAVAPQTIVKGTGPFMSIAHVSLIFWGSEWQQASPPVDPKAVEIAARSICQGPYLEAAYRYANFGSAQVTGIIKTKRPPPPRSFNDADIQKHLTRLLDLHNLTRPKEESQINQFYVVIMPTTSSFAPGGVNGYHSFFDWKNPSTNANERVHYAMLLNNGTLDYITQVFSHELAEAYTDPEGTFIQIAPSNPSNWNEVGDICQSSAFLDGVFVQSYWSQDQNACVIPFYNANDPRDVPPAGLDLEVVAIRRAFSREVRSFWIQKIRARNPANGDTYDLYRGSAAGLIDGGLNTFFVQSLDGARANVLVGEANGHAILITEADESQNNNLLSLPGF